MRSNIEIKPDVLEYNPPFTQQSTQYATVTNTSDHPIVFKVKTTAPKFYCVRPNAALVEPGESVEVQVILLGLTEEPAPDYKCRDKFLIITLPAPNDLGTKSVAEAWPELEMEYKKQAISKKIKVRYNLSSKSSGSHEKHHHSTTGAGASHEDHHYPETELKNRGVTGSSNTNDAVVGNKETKSVQQSAAKSSGSSSSMFLMIIVLILAGVFGYLRFF
ncbi:hypothetical protein TBLA_0I01030 [Henningerozyma blattae CBS 6284]|uniref:MSP domain-containing protein n=1 Tax=Henningerozyma blattae (strain ATCC 34711 / CBS 6284 / DSM 70876 / NBRC 10599 / NRRL Y-10934 / UCD 77-7) TaxID=1071380 RepID=I2H8R0_HENB6|nr:hypothetical protein TBLA_0I01030 [Tetrapisispora blattae CBS 6284]CCH62762.1 hypothetical protein TBLA_0I01030 [Tetrapisispora blattae CBS 6284]